jgi:hypothetical protein
MLPSLCFPLFLLHSPLFLLHTVRALICRGGNGGTEGREGEVRVAGTVGLVFAGKLLSTTDTDVEYENRIA